MSPSICMYVCSLRGSTAATRHWSSTVWSTPSVLWYAIALCTLFTAVFFGVSAIAYVHYVLGRVYSLGFTCLYGRFSAVLLCLAQDVIFGVGFSRVFVKQVWIPLLARREFVALHNVVRKAPLLSSFDGWVRVMVQMCLLCSAAIHARPPHPEAQVGPDAVFRQQESAAQSAAALPPGEALW
jgi:hypothetical protein